MSELIDNVSGVSAFSRGVLEGNPAGVCVVEDFPDDRAMQDCAAEVGYSETAFLCRAGGQGRFEIRYFTPEVEVDLCGHATLAAAFYLWEKGVVGHGETVFFSSKGGGLEASERGGQIWMDFPSDPPGEPLAADGAADILSRMGLLEAEVVYRASYDLMVVLGNEKQVTYYQACAEKLGELETRGIILTAEAAGVGDYDFVSRFFAPRCGVLEDPVTGSAHCVLGPYWAGRLGRGRLTGYQASVRGGMVEVETVGERVQLGGRAEWILV